MQRGIGGGNLILEALREKWKKLPVNKEFDPPVRFDGQTIVITGAGGGLGRAYSLMFAKLGGHIVVNDVSARGAHAVVDEIKGGKAAFFSIVDGSSTCMMFCQLGDKRRLPFSLLKVGRAMS